MTLPKINRYQGNQNQQQNVFHNNGGLAIDNADDSNIFFPNNNINPQNQGNNFVTEQPVSTGNNVNAPNSSIIQNNIAKL